MTEPELQRSGGSHRRLLPVKIPQGNLQLGPGGGRQILPVRKADMQHTATDRDANRIRDIMLKGVLTWAEPTGYFLIPRLIFSASGSSRAIANNSLVVIADCRPDFL